MVSLEYFMKIFNIDEEWEGKALWQIIANRDVFLDGKEVETGSFRWNAHTIADVCGGCYMDYYCANLPYKQVDKLWKRMKKRVTLSKDDEYPYYWRPPGLKRIVKSIKKAVWLGFYRIKFS